MRRLRIRPHGDGGVLLQRWARMVRSSGGVTYGCISIRRYRSSDNASARRRRQAMSADVIGTFLWTVFLTGSVCLVGLRISFGNGIRRAREGRSVTRRHA